MTPIPIADLIEEFLDGYQTPPYAASTCRLMRQSTRELLEDARIKTSQDLSPPAVIRWMNRRPERTPITAALHLRNLRTLCNYAVGRDYLSKSPFDFNEKLKKAVRVRKGAEGKRRHHSMAEIGCVLGYLRDRADKSWEDHRLYALAALASHTGVRALEAQYAEVDDFDMAEGFFRVEPKPIHRLKTDKSERDVPMPIVLQPILREWLPMARSNWAFPGVRRLGPWVGGLCGYRPLDKLKAAAQAVGVPGFTFLSLRHSYITHGCGPWGLGPRVIQQIAGHTSIDTQEHYIGHERANLRAAVAAIAFPIPPRLATA